MRYHLRRVEDGRYVAPPGSKFSYTRDIAKARVYYTWEEAHFDACGNERVVKAET